VTFSAACEAVPFQNVAYSTAKEVAQRSEKQIPCGLKPARDGINKRLRRWPEGQLYPIDFSEFRVGHRE
jgi:hypothetical protein